MTIVLESDIAYIYNDIYFFIMFKEGRRSEIALSLDDVFFHLIFGNYLNLQENFRKS